MLASDCSIAREMRRSWEESNWRQICTKSAVINISTLEANQSSTWLQEPVLEVLNTPLAVLGEGLTSGKTRIVEAIECTRANVLAKTLELV